MKFRVGACALLVCLAGCSADAPDTKFGEQRGAASATPRTAQRLPSVQAGRETAQSIANAPDRGELISYKNKGAAIKREGAYTWYPVAISEAHALKAVVDGVMSIPSPDGSQVKVRYERHVESPDGNWTWIGRVIGGDQQQEAILTFGEKAVYGSIPQKTGAPLSLQTRGGQLYAVQTDLSKVKNPNSRTDMMVPPAQALRSSLLAQASKAQVSQSAVETKAATPASTVDVAIGYTAGFATAQGGQSAAVTRLVFLVEVGNQAFENSLITGAIRVVNALQVNYTDTTTNKAALAELTGRNENNGVVTIPASLVPLRDAREQYGADLAILVRKFQTPENEGCGIAWLNGSGQLPIDPAVDDDYGFGVVSDGNDTGTDGNSYFCAPESLIHEIGHLMGSAHDRDNSKKTDGSQLFGRYPYSFGMKTTAANGNFYTIMSYGDNNQNFYRTFSNPLVLKCGPAGANLPCGVTDQTDNARSLNQTIPVVASFRASVVPFSGVARNDVNGDGKSDLLWSRPGTSQFVHWVMNGNVISSSSPFSIDGAFTAIGSGDLDGNGRVDIIWRNAAGHTYAWMATAAGGYTTSFIYTLSPVWKLVGTGDVDGDGKADLLWSNPASNQFVYWRMNGPAIASSSAFYVDGSYSVIGTGDIDGNGRVDIIWQNAAGVIYAWMGNTNGAYATQFVYTLDPAWKLVGLSDVNADGKADFLWSKPSSSQFVYWLMNGSTITFSTSFLIDGAFTATSFGDFNGDGRADIIWMNSVGHIYGWYGNSNGGFTTQYIFTLTGWLPVK